MASDEQKPILELAERIASAFLDAYHEREGVFEELKREGGSAYQNSMRGALSVIGELEIYAGGRGEALASNP